MPQTHYIANKKVPIGILTNHASFSASGYPVAYELLRQGYSIKKIFSPEHGLFSQGDDGKPQSGGIDSLTHLPLMSLYGSKLMPTPEDLHDLDIILVDLPNIGCRFYTYWWSITYMMEACAQANKKMILLDRPNLSNRTIQSMEGPMLEQNCKSFLGRWSMPLTYSYSYGQLARWFVHELKFNLDLEVIPFDGDPNPIFTPTSPAMNDRQAVWAYPLTGLFEGLNVSVGRGTTFPFRVVGAP